MSPVKRRRRRRGWLHRRRKPLLIGLAGAAGVVLIGLLWCGWTVWKVYDDLQDARDEATILQAALARGDVAGARAAEADLVRAAEDAEESTDGVTWGALESAPVFGDDAEGLTAVASVVRELSSEGLPPLLDAADRLNAGTFAPRNHQFPLAEIAALEAPAASSGEVFARAADDLEGVDSSGFAGPLLREFDNLRTLVVEGAAALDSARRAAALMPGLLGNDGPRDYLLVFQNNAEVRATGGLPGVMSLIHAERGRVDITRQESAGPMGELDRPVLPLSAAERTLFGRQLGTYFMDANFTPHLPRAADLWRARWRAETGGDLDGVLVVDPVAMAYLLQATGPIVVEGRTLSAENVIAEVEHDVYIRHADRGAQDRFFNAVADVAFDTFANGAGDPVALVQGLIRGVTERRILVHSFVAHDQELVSGTTIAGEVPTQSGDRPQVGVYLNSGTAAKLSYFLDHQVDVTSASCSDGRQRLVARMRVTAATPTGIEAYPETVIGYALERGQTEPGHQVLVADLFAPVGGTFTSLEFDGDELPEPAVDSYLGREVISVGLPMAPGQTRTVTWTMVGGPDQPGPVDVLVTPGSHPEAESSVAPSTC